MSATAHSRSGAEDPRASGTAVRGVIEVLSSGNGFLRSPSEGFQATSDDVFVGQGMVKRFALRTGDLIEGEAGPPPGRGKSSPLERIHTINGMPPESVRNRPAFSSLPAAYPKEQLKLEVSADSGPARGVTNRVVDLIAPLGKGQRALIVAPARAGKTMLLQSIMEGVAINYPEAVLLILLVDERPEEVTEMQMFGRGEVIASSFDCPADRHVAVAEMTLEHARRHIRRPVGRVPAGIRGNARQ